MRRIPFRRVQLLLVPAMLALMPGQARAQWVENGAAVAALAGTQASPAIVSDGAGGAIVAWQDDRGGVPADIYLQRMDARGIAQWPANGVAICLAGNAQVNPQLVSDGAGGAIVVWQDFRAGNYDIYAQRVDAGGLPLWATDGIPLCTAANEQSLPRIVSNGAGGAIVSWQDLRAGNYDIYAQRVDAAGVTEWAANGIALCAVASNQMNHRMIAGTAGDAIVVWQDFRWGQSDIYGQRVTASGVLWWTVDGIWVCTATGSQEDPQLAPDGAGGAIITWEDLRNNRRDIYAQHMVAAGGSRWTVDGVPVCLVSTDLEPATIASDGAGGAILTWTDVRTGTGQSIYAQRLNSSGAPQWTVNGIVVAGSGGQGSPRHPRIVSDTSGGAIVSFVKESGFNDVYAQRLSASGSVQWAANGVPVCTASGGQTTSDLVADGRGGAIITWQDTRSGTQDIYAQRIQAQGVWGHPEPVLTSVTDVPTDQGGRVGVEWIASGWDASGFNTITHYSLWRQASSSAAGMDAIVHEIDPSRIGPDFAETGRRVVATPNGMSTTWEFIVTVPARYAAQYRYTAATLADSVEGDAADEWYQALAHTTNAFVFYESNTLAGHSVDNLAPAAPLALSAQRSGKDVHLRWNRVTAPDLRDYSLYRATSSGVTPVPENFLASTGDTVLVDTGAPEATLHYVVTAHDIHGNQGAASNEASTGAPIGVGGDPPILAFTVGPNHPNPCTDQTAFRIGLPARSEVTIDVYDVSGRRVARRRLAGMDAGWHTVPLQARDDRSRPLASGIYTCRFTAAGSTVARKLMVLR